MKKTTINVLLFEAGLKMPEEIKRSLKESKRANISLEIIQSKKAVLNTIGSRKIDVGLFFLDCTNDNNISFLQKILHNKNDIPTIFATNKPHLEDGLESSSDRLWSILEYQDLKSDLLLSLIIQAFKFKELQKKHNKYHESQIDFSMLEPIGLVIIDKYKVIQALDTRFCKLIGYSEKDLIGKRIEIIWSNLIDNISIESSGYSRKYYFITIQDAESREKPVIVSLIKINTANQEQFAVSLYQLSSFASSESTILIDQLKYKSLLEHLPAGVYRIDPYGKILEANQTFAKILGYGDKKELYMKNINEFYLNERARTVHLKKVEIFGTYFEEAELKCKDGRIICCWDYPYAESDENGKVLYYDGVIVDITERKLSEDELVIYRRLLEERVKERTEELTDINKRLEGEIEERKKIEKALRESEATTRTLLNATDYSLVLTKPNGTILATNSITAERSGIPLEKMIGTSIFDYLSLNMSADIQDYIYRVIDTGAPTSFELERDKNFSKISIHPVKNEDNKVIQLAFYIADITQLKRTEEIIRKERDKAQNYLDIAGVMLVVIDSNRKVSMINKKGCEILEYNDHEIIGRDWFDFIPERDREITSNKISNSEMRTPIPPGDFESNVLTKNNAEKTISWHSTVLGDTNGQIIGILSSGEDITEKMILEDKLRSSEEQYRTLVDNINVGICRITTDHDPGFMKINRYMKSLFGYESDEQMQMIKLNNIFLNNDDQKAFLQEILDKGYVRNHDMTLKKMDGSSFYASFTAITHYDKEGTPLWIDSVIIDITNLKKAEQEKRDLEAKLQRSEKMEMLGTLAGGVAHDLNNLLSAIVAYPDLLLCEVPKDSKMHRPIVIMREAAQKAAAIVDDLLTLTRRGVTVREVINLNDIIDDYLKSPIFTRLKNTHKDLDIEIKLRPDLLNILASPIHITKVLMNLVLNAVEAMPSGGKLKIATYNKYIDKPFYGYEPILEGEYSVLKISDTGIGIPKKNIERIFEPFYTRKIMGRSGTGLGMSVVWGTVKDHGGYIDIESEEGKGTCLCIYYPVTREQRISDEKSLKFNITKYYGNREKILVVDDVDEQREIAFSLLAELGYQPITISNGEKAIEYTRNNKVDLVLLDMIMEPGIDGCETFKRLIDIKPDIKTLITSGFSESERVKEAQQLGAGPYLKKPYTIEKLAVAIKKELSKK